jgi:Tfp pilus assembly protein FimV
MVAALVLVMAQAGAALGGSSHASPERRPAAVHTSARSTVVRPGDSLWSLASRLAPGSDPRPVVDALAAARHGTVLVPGETIEWDG